MAKKLDELRKSKWLTAILHIAGWALFLALPYLLRNANTAPHPPKYFPPVNHRLPPHQQFEGHLQYEAFAFNLLLIILFYINVLFLVPRFLLKKRYWQFLAIQVLNFIGVNYMLTLLHGVFAPDMLPVRKGFLLFIHLLLTLFGVCYCLIRQSIQNEQKQKERENETLKSELTFLRWQISPHFLFNVLNSMVALSRVKSDKLEPMLIQLSTLMRYMTYDNGQRKITLEKELEYLQSYIDLQSIRLGNDITIDAKLNVSPVTTLLIEPMLLIPFVENAFKHGTGLIEKPIINISLDIEADHLLFRIRNKSMKSEGSIVSQSPGIGLANVRRRLELIYGNDFTLEVKDQDGYFEVFLRLRLK